MRAENSSVIDALGLLDYDMRDFVYIWARDFDDNSVQELGLWSDVGVEQHTVIDGITRTPVVRTFYGTSVVSIDRIQLVSDLTVRTLNITLSHLSIDVINLIRGYNVRFAPIQIYRGVFDVDTHVLINAAVPRFVGIVNKCEITIPEEGGNGSVSLSCDTTTRLLTRPSPEVRSHEVQKLRSATDDFRRNVTDVPDWEIHWGEVKGNVVSR